MQGRPGPVVIALPEDMLLESAAVAAGPRVEPVETWPGLTQMADLQKRLWAAKRPVLVLGGSGWTETACARVRRFAERFDLPVATSFRRAMLFPGDHPNYAGEIGLGPNPKLKARIENADLVHPRGRPDVRGAVAGLHAVRHSRAAPDARACPCRRRGARPGLPPRARHQRDAARLRRRAGDGAAAERDHVERADRGRRARTTWPGPSSRSVIPGTFQYGEAMAWLRNRLPEDAIVTNGAGNYAIWVGRFMRFRRFGTQLAPVSGSMGYGLPAAVGAKRQFPDRMVVCFAGDGCFLMNGQEFATAVQYDLPIIVVVVDNGMYGTIRMHQEREYPGRVSATKLKNPDFAAYAVAFGGHGERVETTDAVRAGLRARGRVRQAGDPARPDRPRGDHPGHDAHRNAREGAGRKAMTKGRWPFSP